jgi:preprotein translocase subunit SecD
LRRRGRGDAAYTRANVGKPMAVVYIEKSRRMVEENGQKVQRDVTEQKVISVATIRGVFSNQFQITGLTAGEARELALLLRAGSLAAPIYIIEERAIGPSLGQDNIDKGVRALIIGMLAVFVFALYYAFGLVANLVLLMNVVMLTALLSILRASLSLPALPASSSPSVAGRHNVLIYERIRESCATVSRRRPRSAPASTRPSRRSPTRTSRR